MAETPERLPHLFVPEGRARTEIYRSEMGRGPTRDPPARDRQRHGNGLMVQLDAALVRARERENQRTAFGIGTDRGVILEFASDPNTELMLKSLENKTRGIELLAVRNRGQAEVAVVYVPNAAIGHFNQVITAYLTRETPAGNPKHQPLVNSIAEIRLAVLESFWTDAEDQLPRDEQAIWWEVWLRRETADLPPPALLRFRREADALGVRVTERSIPFPDRVVALAKGSLTQLARCAELLGSIAELRRAKETPAAFFQLTPAQEAEWVRDLAGRITPPPPNAPRVCLLDTGVDREHPLLVRGIRADDMHSVVRAWGPHDHAGHGTEMAGVCLLGDLMTPLAGRAAVSIGHWLESVKILPPTGENEPDLYGAITAEGLYRAESTGRDQRRVACMAITSSGRDRGRPSSWSAAIDDLAAGTNDPDGQRRLIVVSAGNARREEARRYPDSNETDPIQDPGHAWNALTVGAFTSKALIDDPGYEGWSPVARGGGLSPWTTTSTIFARGWPIKPDIVLEGGNLALEPPPDARLEEVDSLQILTTRSRQLGGTPRLLTTTFGTSPAAASAASMAATLWGRYPALWPETVRALLVHSAEWTREMLARYVSQTDRRGEKLALVRCCGFGAPNLQRALWSARNALTLIVQESLTPYGTDENRRANMRDMHLHPLPWPRAELLRLGDADVEMRVTLSYFVEASPGQRGWRYRHRYASHGLRFDVNTPHETVDQFRHRLNRHAREEEDGHVETSPDSDRWFLGPRLRAVGSIQSDRWKGSAAELALRGFVGIYPIIGWWRERPDLGKLDRSARYSLIVSITTPVQTADVYTPVANEIGVPIAIEGLRP